jgi:hypothetical protein
MHTIYTICTVLVWFGTFAKGRTLVSLNLLNPRFLWTVVFFSASFLTWEISIIGITKIRI